MSYPQTFLTRHIRRGIMIALIILFCVIAPLLIFYTAGYRYDFTTHEIKQTGVISIDVQPQDTTVSLNNILIKQTLPIRLANRAPGTYHLKLHKPGYKDWEKDISVNSKQTTYIKDVTLFRDTLPVAAFNERSSALTAMSSAPTGDFLLTVEKQAAIFTTSLINTNSSKTTALLREKNDTPPIISWSPFASLALITTIQHNTATLSLVNPTENKIIATLPLANGVAPTTQWNINQNDPSVWVEHAGKITKLDRAGAHAGPTLPSSTTHWFIDRSNNLWVVNANRTLSDRAHPQLTFSAPRDVSRIIDINENRIILKTESQFLVLHRSGDTIDRQETVDGTNAVYNSFTKEWITWSSAELWTIYDDGHAILLNRTSDKIISVHPLDPHGLLLLHTGKGLIGFNPGYYVTHELFRDGMMDAIGVNQKNRKLYFWGEIGKQRDIFELDY